MTQHNRTVTAILGPTNTGKTHLAIERMLAHESGIIGLPLRLLAREVYTRMVAKAGSERIALITGEEKIVPAKARYYVCTVEAMPRALDVAFVAIDEVQLAADFDRGHIFTQRMLALRGQAETLLLGALTIRPLIEKLLPGASILTRPRFSQLSYSGPRKLTRLPSRTAIVVFSASDVYEIAELIRRQRGGAAVVLGSLSPRTRNAQVALYQSGDVDYLVATDAIGMGLNLDVNHIAFAGSRKYDGHQYRELTAAEVAQIAGRAGRYKRDGTFGVTGRLEPFDARLVEAVEAHEFSPLKVIQWRNDKLDFSSLAALRASLDGHPKHEGLARTLPGADVLALDQGLKSSNIQRLAALPGAVESFWDVCQLPDYRKITPANHFDIIASLFERLMHHETIPEDWFGEQIAYGDNTEGDIDTIANRIAHIRTWTFVANRPDWLKDPKHWQERTRAIEDRLSDALHACLMQRFVDKRTSVLMKQLRENQTLAADICKDGEIWVEGQAVGCMQGLRFSPQETKNGIDAKLVRTAAQRVVVQEIQHRAGRLSQARDGAFSLTRDHRILWAGEEVAHLVKGPHPLYPQIAIVADEHLSGHARKIVHERLETWLADHLRGVLAPLFALKDTDDFDASVRGLAFRLVEAFGVVERQTIAAEVRAIAQEQRAILRNKGVRFGAHHVYIPDLLRPGPRALLAQLYLLSNPKADADALELLLNLALSGRTSLPVEAIVSGDVYALIGFRPCGSLAIRIDILERLADLIRPAIAWRLTAGSEVAIADTPMEKPDGPEQPVSPPAPPPEGAAPGNGFTVSQGMISLLGCSHDEMRSVLKSLGYRVERKLQAHCPEEAHGPLSGKAAGGSKDPDSTSGTPVVGSLNEPDQEVIKPTVEPQVVEIWRPRFPNRKRRKSWQKKTTGSSKTKSSAPSGSHGKCHKTKERNVRPGKVPTKPVRKKTRSDQKKMRRQQVDPDSPFAALATLKERIKNGTSSESKG